MFRPSRQGALGKLVTLSSILRLNAFYKESYAKLSLLAGYLCWLGHHPTVCAIEMDTTSTIDISSSGVLFLTYFDLAVLPDEYPVEVVCGVSQRETFHPLISIMSTLSGHASYIMQTAKFYLK